MKYLVLIIILMGSVYSGNFLYYKTDICDFIINKLRVNTKIKCMVLDFISVILVVQLISNVLINYKDIFSGIGLFIAVIIGGLSQYIKIELKAYNKK